MSARGNDEPNEFVEQGMEGLLAAASDHTPPPSGSTKRLVSDESEDDTSPELRKSIAFVQERLLSFCDHQLEHQHPPHIKEHHKAPSIHEQLPIHKPHAYPCQDTHVTLPSHPSQWPQSPCMLCPSPNTNTQIRGIRRANSMEYQHFAGFCAGCILPINTGKESAGNSLVIDFESPHFVGTLLMRINNVPSTTVAGGAQQDECDNHESSPSYFDGKKRRFQAVVKGKFKMPLKMSECVTGQSFTRPAGNLPPRWIVASFVKFVSTLAPQLQVCLHGEQPRFLTPLVATAHSVLETPSSTSTTTRTSEEESPQDNNDENDDDRLYNYQVYKGSQDIEDYIVEPPATDASSVMNHVHGVHKTDAASTVAKRQKLRKKAFNALSAQHAEEPCFQLDQEYSFEFYQHLLLFGSDGLALDLGRPIGHVPLAPITDGQPIKFMSAHKDPVTGELNELWSFDIWHESLYPYAQAAEEDRSESGGDGSD